MSAEPCDCLACRINREISEEIDGNTIPLSVASALGLNLGRFLAAITLDDDRERAKREFQDAMLAGMVETMAAKEQADTISEVAGHG